MVPLRRQRREGGLFFSWVSPKSATKGGKQTIGIDLGSVIFPPIFKLYKSSTDTSLLGKSGADEESTAFCIGKEVSLNKVLVALESKIGEKKAALALKGIPNSVQRHSGRASAYFKAGLPMERQSVVIPPWLGHPS